MPLLFVGSFSVRSKGREMSVQRESESLFIPGRACMEHGMETVSTSKEKCKRTMYRIETCKS